LTDPWQMRDTSDKEGKKKEKEDVNTYKLDDNCYYVTTAKLLGTTVEKLIGATEEMQYGGGASIGGIETLLKATGKKYRIRRCADLDAVSEVAEKVCGGLDRSFGIAFGRRNGTGHVVVMNWDAADKEATFIDYQKDPKGAKAKDDVSGGILFYLYWFE
jgi:hypothetical protein